MDELGLLTALISELNPARGVSQPRVHVWDVFDHSIQTVAAVEFVLREGTLEYAGEDVLAMVPWSAELSRHFDREISSGSTGRSLLKLAALLHDIAKPQTKTMDDGRARFLGHQQEGAATAAAVMERLRFSNREIKLVELLIKYHLRPTQMSHEGIPTRRAIYRYFRDTGEAGIDLLFLCLADHLATRGPSLDLHEWQEHTQMTGYVLDKRFEEESLSAPPRLIDGHDIMKVFGLNPGPVIGELLEALRETQAAGEVTDRKQALDYIEHLLNNHIRKTHSQGEQ
jgi:poly(A) polymerase